MQARHRLCKGRNSWLRQQIRRQLWRGIIKAPRCWQRDREHKGPARWRYLSKYLHRTHSKRAMLRRFKKKSIIIFTSQTGQFMGTRLVSVFLDFFYVMSESSCSLVTNAAHDQQLSRWPLRQSAVSLGDQSQYSKHTPTVYSFPPTLICLSLFFLHHRILIWICTLKTIQTHLCCCVQP